MLLIILTIKKEEVIEVMSNDTFFSSDGRHKDVFLLSAQFNLWLRKHLVST